VRNARGNRNVVALAGDWRASAATRVEAEVEHSHRSQPSVPGFSMLGETVPHGSRPASEPQQPAVVAARGVRRDDGVAARHAEARRRLAARRRTGLAQRLRTDDRVAFPFGCGPTAPDPADDLLRPLLRERQLRLSRLPQRRRAPSQQHARRLAARQRRDRCARARRQCRRARTVVRNRFQQSAFNFAGTGNVDGTLVVPPAPDLTTPNTNRDERSTELALRDAIALGGSGATSGSARATRSSRAAPRRPTARRERRSPVVHDAVRALSHEFARGQLVYASWGRGVESDVAPNVPLVDARDARYTNAGQALPAAESRQIEIGAKGGALRAEWSAAAFDIRRPLFGERRRVRADACTRGLVGDQRHRRRGQRRLARRRLGRARRRAMAARARRGSSDPTLDGKKPTNVPTSRRACRATSRSPAVAGLAPARRRHVREQPRGAARQQRARSRA
jgi:iron complex outermembrane receptor protein